MSGQGQVVGQVVRIRLIGFWCQIRYQADQVRIRVSDQGIRSGYQVRVVRSGQVNRLLVSIRCQADKLLLRRL